MTLLTLRLATVSPTSRTISSTIIGGNNRKAMTTTTIPKLLQQIIRQQQKQRNGSSSSSSSSMILLRKFSTTSSNSSAMVNYNSTNRERMHTATIIPTIQYTNDTNNNYLYLHKQQLRFQTNNSNDDNNDTSTNATDIDTTTPKYFYNAPLGKLIVRLKRISIASCIMSLIGLPALVVIKNGGVFIPTTQQIGLGTLALIGATGSTIALQFVFGPYILTMENIPIRKCKSTKEGKNHDDDDDDNNNEIIIDSNNDSNTMIKATTVNVFGMYKEHIFDPTIDNTISAYSGNRPFANFVAKDKILYAHPELLEQDMRQLLLWSKTTKTTEATTTTTTATEGIPPSQHQRQETTTKKKKDDDDDFF